MKEIDLDLAHRDTKTNTDEWPKTFVDVHFAAAVAAAVRSTKTKDGAWSK